jgi:hypothetical protein
MQDEFKIVTHASINPRIDNKYILPCSACTLFCDDGSQRQTSLGAIEGRVIVNVGGSALIGVFIAVNAAPPLAAMTIFGLATTSLLFAAVDINKGMQLSIRQKNLKHIIELDLLSLYQTLINKLESSDYDEGLKKIFENIVDSYDKQKHWFGASCKSKYLLEVLKTAVYNPSNADLKTALKKTQTPAQAAQAMKAAKTEIKRYLCTKGNHGKKLFTIIGEEANEHFKASETAQHHPPLPH